MKIFLKDLGVVVFREKHLADSTGGPWCMFDVLPLGIDEVDPELLFCASLLDKALNFEKTLMKAFLEYQCKLKSNPIRWLSHLEKLLSINGQLLIQNGCVKKMTDLFELIDEQKNVLEDYQIEKSTIEFIGATEKEKGAIGLPEESKVEDSGFIKLPWNGPTNALADLFFQATKAIGENGDPLLPAKSSAIIDFILDHFERVDGKAFSRSSLQTYLTPSRADKRPSKGKGIQLRELLEDQNEE